jgi:glucan biosynthesis protein
MPPARQEHHQTLEARVSSIELSRVLPGHETFRVTALFDSPELNGAIAFEVSSERARIYAVGQRLRLEITPS